MGFYPRVDLTYEKILKIFSTNPLSIWRDIFAVNFLGKLIGSKIDDSKLISNINLHFHLILFF